MAKQGKTLPARRRRGGDDSVVIRSAESLGRMIGSLQRQLDGATRALKLGSVDALLAGRTKSHSGNGAAGPPTPVPEPRKSKPPKSKSGAPTPRAARTAAPAAKKTSRPRRPAAVRKAARHA